MQKVDFKKELKDLYKASDKKVSYIDVPPMKFLMMDGQGDPNNNPVFQEALDTLYGIAYALKFMLKQNKDLQPEEYFEFVVPPLESLWWMEGQEFDPEKKDEWKWTLMIMQAGYINDELVKKAVNELSRKKDTPGLKKLRFETFNEGKAAQIMHIGPYSEVDKAINKILIEFDEKDYKFVGKHHELYFSDPRKVPPEKLKTIVRMPYR